MTNLMAAVGFERVVELVRRIVSESSEEREAGAENASDWARLFDPEEADTVVRLLAVAAAVEQQQLIREAQLHAILEISNSVALGTGSLYPLRLLKARTLDREQLRYLAELGVQPEGDY
jgi:hypothetical protein